MNGVVFVVTAHFSIVVETCLMITLWWFNPFMLSEVEHEVDIVCVLTEILQFSLKWDTRPKLSRL